MQDDNEDIVACVGKVVKVEEVPVRNGIVAHTETLIDLTEDAKLLSPGGIYSGPVPLKHLVLMAELKYGKRYEIVLREVKPKLVDTRNGRRIQASNE